MKALHIPCHRSAGESQGADAIEIDGEILYGRGPVQGNSIQANAAIDVIYARETRQEIVAVPANERVHAIAGRKRIVPVSATKQIVASVAEERIRAISADERVAAGALPSTRR